MQDMEVSAPIGPRVVHVIGVRIVPGGQLVEGTLTWQVVDQKLLVRAITAAGHPWRATPHFGKRVPKRIEVRTFAHVDDKEARVDDLAAGAHDKGRRVDRMTEVVDVAEQQQVEIKEDDTRSQVVAEVKDGQFGECLHRHGPCPFGD